MGLDITAYSKLQHVGRHVEVWCEDENHVAAFAYDSFPASFRGIPVLTTTHGRWSSSFLDGGCYAITADTKVDGFHAGSYGGYNRWRRDLANQFNPYAGEEIAENGLRYPLEPDPEKPFYELIWFADNEGTIGPEAAADLLVDFQNHASAYSPDLYWMRALYADWTRAFELAADGGLVSFH